MTGGVPVYGGVGRRDVPLETQGVTCYSVIRHVGFAAESALFVFGLGGDRSSVLVTL